MVGHFTIALDLSIQLSEGVCYIISFSWEKTYSEMEINEVRSDWAMLMTQLIITHA